MVRCTGKIMAMPQAVGNQQTPHRLCLMALCPGDAAAAPGARAVRGAAAAAAAAAPGGRAVHGAGAGTGAAESERAGTGAAETEAIGEVEKDQKKIGGAKEETGEKPGRG